MASSTREGCNPAANARMVPGGYGMTVLLIQGMRGAPCREIVVGALSGIPGVVEVDVNLFRAVAVVIHQSRFDELLMIDVLRSLGYMATVAPRTRGKEHA